MISKEVEDITLNLCSDICESVRNKITIYVIKNKINDAQSIEFIFLSVCENIVRNLLIFLIDGITFETEKDNIDDKILIFKSSIDTILDTAFDSYKKSIRN